jgi:A/G-specific adenine glycosylase
MRAALPVAAKTRIRRALLAWYRRHRRDLPWRRTSAPYRVWLSEIMLQQTRVETVIPYYTRFLKAFPAVNRLAAAPLERVLTLWQGLGYYRRARNLHHAAQTLARDGFPRTAPEWAALPGVGRYTAAAIASICYNEPVAALDGNIKCVLARLCGVPEPIDAPSTQARLWQLADELLARRSPGDFNQALMELGARVCTPRSPACQQCPVQRDCAAHAAGLQTELPRRKPRRSVPEIFAAAAFCRRGKRWLMRRRGGGLLGGMWTLPTVESGDGPILPTELARGLQQEGLEVRVGERLGDVEHTFSHRRLIVHVYRAKLCSRDDLPGDCQWVQPCGLGRLPLASLDRKLLRAAGVTV